MDPLLRIVLVEDELITALDVARRLRRLGYQVVGRASSGPQAIAQAFAHHPDIVLMDIHLQGDMDGVDASRPMNPAHAPPMTPSPGFDRARRSFRGLPDIGPRVGDEPVAVRHLDPR
jgi:DNA-binding NtrC family response regulator